MNHTEYKIHQNVKKWNVFFTIFFIAIMLYFYRTLFIYGRLPESIRFSEALILSLAIFRMIRLFVYDNIFLFLRESFMDKEIMDENGHQTIRFVDSRSSLKRTLSKLSLCPWCMGVWITLCSLFGYYMLPGTYFLFLILAISSIASIFQLLANNIGWHAEYKKLQSERMVTES